LEFFLHQPKAQAQEQENDDRYSFSLPRTTANTKHRYRKIITIYWMLDKKYATTGGTLV
jgi:hypothetical protein